MLVHSNVLPTFSSMMFSVAGFMLRALIHLDLSFMHGNRYGSIFILLHVEIQLYQHHSLNMLCFFHLIFFCFCVKNQVFKDVWIDIWVFYSYPVVLLSVLMPQSSSFKLFLTLTLSVCGFVFCMTCMYMKAGLGIGFPEAGVTGSVSHLKQVLGTKLRSFAGAICFLSP